MKIRSLALLVFIIRSAGTVNVKEHNELRARAITEHHASDSEYHVDTVTVVRQKRAGSDPFTEYHSKMTLAARIFSGIAMRIGLHDGSVSGDQVVSELLNLPPSLQLDDVANFDKAKVDQLFRDLAGLNLDTQNGRVTELEAKIRTMDQLRVQYEKIANPDDTSGIDDYIGKVKKFADANVDVSFLKDAGSITLSTAQPSLRKLKDDPASSIQQSDLVTLATRLNAIVKLPQQIETLLTTLNDNHKALLSNDIMDAAIVKDVELVRELFNVRAVLISVSTNVPPEFNNLLTSINGLASKFDAVSSHLELILHIGRFESTSRLPSGFIHGLSDVLKSSSDVVDPWLPGAIPKYDSALVKSGLQPLDQFRSSFTGLQTKWKSLDDTRVRSQLLKVGDTFNRSRSLTDAVAFAAIEGKQAPQVNDDFAQKVTTFVENILKFRATLINLISKLKSIGKMDELHRLKELTRFKDDIDFSNNRKLSDVLQKMPDATKIDKLIDVLKVLLPKFLDIEALLNGAPLTNLPTKIEQNKGDIGVFLSDNDKKTVFDYFNFLKTLKTHLESLSESVDLVHTVRAIKSDANFQSELETVTSTISASISDFKALRAVPAAINSTQMPRIDEFVQLKGLEGPSKTFGEAVMVLDTAHQILKKKADIEQMMTAGWNVAGLIASSPDKKKLEKEWGNFGEIHLYFGQLLAELESKRSSLTRRFRRATSSLDDLASKLATFKGMQSLEIDLRRRIEVLKRLTSPELPQLQSTMDSLSRMDLKFASHDAALNSVAADVASATSLFGQISLPATPKTPTNSSAAPIPAAPSALDAASNSADAGGATSEPTWWDEHGFLVGALVLIALAALGGLLIWFFCCRKRKQKKTKDPLEKDKLLPTPVPSGVATASNSKETLKTTGAAQKTAKPSKSADAKPEPVKPKEPVKPPEPPKQPTTPAKPKQELATEYDAVDKTASPLPSLCDALDKSLTDEEVAQRKLALYEQFFEEKLYHLQFSIEKRKFMDAEFVRKSRKEKEKRDAEIQLLEERMNADVVKEVRLSAEQEVMDVQNLVVNAYEQFHENECLNTVAHVQAMRQKFAELNPSDDIVRLVRASHNVWSANNNKTYVCSRRLTDGELDFVQNNMIDIKINEQKFKLKQKLEVSNAFILRPFTVRIIWADIAVAKKQLAQTKHNAAVAMGKLNADIIPFDHRLVEEADLMKLNITYLPMPYNERVYICARTMCAVDDYNNFIWNTGIGFTVGFDSYRGACFKNTQHFHFSTVELEASLSLDYYRPYQQWEVTMTKVAGGETHEFLHTLVDNMLITTIDDGEKEKVADQLGWLMGLVTRQKDLPVMFVDDHGDVRASSLALSEQIAASIATDGILEADVLIQLYKLLTSRCKVFSDMSGPLYLMLAVLLGVERVFMESSQKTGTFRDKWWTRFANIADERVNRQLVGAQFGDAEAEKYKLVPDEPGTIDLLERDILREQEEARRKAENDKQAKN